MIYTLTFNPALDYVMRFGKIVPGSVCRSVYEEITAGGKGINVSVVLRELGLSSTALGFTAGFTGEYIERLLEAKGIKCDFIRLDSGFSRINVKLKAENETDLNARGPEIPDEKIKLLFEKLSRLESGDMLVLAGSVPDTLPPDIYEKILAMLSGKGVRFTVDATGSLLMNVLKYKPFLIKPNNFELGELFGTRADTDDEIEKYARRLKALGAVNVLVSMAEKGAMLIDANDKCQRISAAKGKAVNSVGAGDSMVAGFLAATESGKDYGCALRLGSAAGSATAFSEGLASAGKIKSILETEYASEN